jgi:hypothetical protein
VNVDFLAQEPLVLRFWFVTLGCVFLGALGVGLEVARVISRDNGGVSTSLLRCRGRCADDPNHYPRLLRAPEKCILLRLDSVPNCERAQPPPVWALLTVRAIQVVLSLSALRPARDHDQRLRRGYPIVECTQNHAF